MKKRYWIAILCAVLALVLTVAAASADTGDVYGLMTDVNGLHDGDRIILVSDDGSNYQAMATDFSGMQVTLTDNTITEQNGMLALTLTETDGGWLLASNDEYLAVNGGALTIVSDSASASVWTISIASDGTATVSCTGDAIVFAEQDGAYRFFCGEGGNEIAIYNATYEAEQHPLGDGVWWSFANGKLTIGGSGSVPGFYFDSGQPWSSIRSGITEVEVLDGIDTVGMNMFAQCWNLTKVTLPDSVVTIGPYAFYNCTSLADITIPPHVTNIQYDAFNHCSSLTRIDIPQILLLLESRAFADCYNLTEITIGNNLIEVGADVFENTGWWKAQSGGVIYLDDILLGVKGTCGQIVRIEDGTRLIASQAFYDESQITKVTIPDSVTIIGYKAFYSCTGLSDITIPGSVTSFGNSAFESCTGLQSVTIENGVKSIGGYAFCNCTGLTSVTIGDGVTSIKYDAFYGCTRLSEITIPGSVTSIGEDAFGGCTGLSEITIPGSVTSIGKYAFCVCTGLTSVTIENGVKSIGEDAFGGCTGLISVTIPDSVTSIADYAFSGCTGLISVTIGNGVTSFGSWVFDRCTGLQSVTIGDGVTNIGSWAFNGCTNLTSVTLPCSASLEGFCFSGCSGITYVRLTKGTGEWNLWYVNAPWTDYPSVLKTVVLDEGITYIQDSIFQNCTGLTEVMMPSSLRTIGHGAFQGCTSLAEITIPDGVTTIEDRCFMGCANLREITIPDSVTTIGWNAFQGCTSLAEITIPDSVTTIESGAFQDCTSLAEITIPDGVTTIEDRCFMGCANLREITIPDSVTYIDYSAFQDCTSLAEITIPKSVRYIYYSAFSGCTAMTDVYYLGTESERIRNLYISSEDNDYLLNATWHYPTVPFEGTVEWNPEDVQFKGTTPYVIANGSAQTPRFTVKNSADGSVVDPANYDFEYRENTNAGTGYVIVTFKRDYEGTCRGFFKIYLPPTTTTTVENVGNGIKLTWSPVEGAAGYVIYRRAWSSTTDGWTTFERWNNTTGTTYIDGADDSHKVYAGTRYQYGVKAYFARRVDPVTGATIGGNVGDNFNLGEVGPLKTTVRITTRVLNSVTAGSRQMTVKWTPSRNFTGYQIKYATDANFTKNVKAIKITDWSTAEKIITGLTRGTTYYVTIRSYHEFNGMTYFGEWSNVKSCRVR